MLEPPRPLFSWQCSWLRWWLWGWAGNSLIWATGPGLAIATKNSRQLGIKAPLYLAHCASDFNFLRLAGDAANDVLLPSSKIYVASALPATDPQKAVTERFVSAYETKYGKKPATFAADGYDAMMIIAAAFRKARPDREHPGEVRGRPGRYPIFWKRSSQVYVFHHVLPV